MSKGLSKKVKIILGIFAVLFLLSVLSPFYRGSGYRRYDSEPTGQAVSRESQPATTIQPLITKSAVEMLPTPEELPTEFTIGEIKDITENMTKNAFGFESGKMLSIDKYKILGIGVYDYTSVDFGVYKFSAINYARSFFDSNVNNVKSSGGYAKLSFSTDAECFSWKTDYGYETGKIGESICKKKNVVFWISVSMVNTWKQPDSTVKDMTLIVDRKVK